MRGAVAVVVALTGAAQAQEARVWPGTIASAGRPASVVLHAPTAEGARASVTFTNETVHHAGEAFVLRWDGIAVTIQVDWQVDAIGSERVTVDPPDGYVAVPRQITVGEGRQDTLHIFKFLGL